MSESKRTVGYVIRKREMCGDGFLYFRKGFGGFAASKLSDALKYSNRASAYADLETFNDTWQSDAKVVRVVRKVRPKPPAEIFAHFNATGFMLGSSRERPKDIPGAKIYRYSLCRDGVMA